MAKTKMEMNKEIRETFMNTVEAVDVTEFDYLGRVVEGLVFQNADGKVVVIKTIVKEATFDLEDAFEEYNDKEQARIDREAERAAKRAKREAEKAAKQAEKDAKFAKTIKATPADDEDVVDPEDIEDTQTDGEEDTEDATDVEL